MNLLLGKHAKNGVFFFGLTRLSGICLTTYFSYRTTFSDAACSMMTINCIIFTAHKRSLRRLCFYRCLSFILFTGGGCAWFYSGGVCGFIWGACVVLFGGHAWFYSGGMCGFIRGGMHGFIRGACMVLFRGACMVLFRGRAWFYSGGMRGFILGGHAWFYLGGVHGFIWGGMRGFIQGGMCGFFSFFGYNEIRSMSGRYASYWNAFLFSTRLDMCQ